jgi:predicted AlkP superfamily phosphohydrolase/phosphomutase
MSYPSTSIIQHSIIRGKMGRILIIGLDGATFDLISPWVHEDKLPNIKQLLNNGTSAILESTPFPNSGPAWVSSVTGVNPGKHGIFAFGIRDKNNNYRLQLPNSTSIRAKTLPLLLTEYGKRSGLINVPMTYPPYKINGFIISGMLTPKGTENYTYPPELEQELSGAVPEYNTEVSPVDFDFSNAKEKDTFAKALLNSIKVRTEAAKLLIRQEDWDLLFIVFSELDRVQHIFWSEMDESHPLHHEKDKTLSSTIRKTYQELDRSIGILLDNLPGDTKVLIISDHGFGPYEKIFYMNKFLNERGFLTLKRKKLPQISKAIKNVVKKIPGAKGVYKSLTRQSRRKSDPRHERQKIKRWIREELIDWGRTRAFADQYGVRINMKGREPKGIVSPGREAESLKEVISNQLLSLKFPHNGRPVFTDINQVKDVYHGPFVDKAPDLITFMEVGEPHPAYDVATTFGDSPTTTGGHKKDGIFIACGQGIKQGQHLKKANIIDITPTVCYSLDVPLTPEMDGTVLKIFEEGVDTNKINERRGTSMREEIEQTIYKAEHEAEIKDRLKKLGYID